jgi:hypothetical protein
MFLSCFSNPIAKIQFLPSEMEAIYVPSDYVGSIVAIPLEAEVF